MTDWLMVIITAIYVVATITICYFNGKSAKAAREQLEESQRQYEDKKRLEIMPYIQFEKTRNPADHELHLVLDSAGSLNGIYDLSICMKNIGNGTAKDITHIYQWANLSESYDRGLFPIQALSSGECKSIKIEFSYSGNITNDRAVCFVLHYKDLLENEYIQKLNIKFKYNKSATLSLVELSTTSPILATKKENDNV